MRIVLGRVQPATEFAKIKIEKTSKLTRCIWMSHTSSQRCLRMSLCQVHSCPFPSLQHVFRSVQPCGTPELLCFGIPYPSFPIRVRQEDVGICQIDVTERRSGSRDKEKLFHFGQGYNTDGARLRGTKQCATQRPSLRHVQKHKIAYRPGKECPGAAKSELAMGMISQASF